MTLKQIIGAVIILGTGGLGWIIMMIFGGIIGKG